MDPTEKGTTNRTNGREGEVGFMTTMDVDRLRRTAADLKRVVSMINRIRKPFIVYLVLLNHLQGRVTACNALDSERGSLEFLELLY